jgi:hypothetical protein
MERKRLLMAVRINPTYGRLKCFTAFQTGFHIISAISAKQLKPYVDAPYPLEFRPPHSLITPPNVGFQAG